MCSVQEMQHIDQELLSEVVESLINPAFINICAPLMGSNNPFFSLQLTGEGLWQWRKLHSHCLTWLKLATDYRRLLALKLGWPSTEE